MKGKNILVTAACVIGFGGIIANTLVGVATSRELKKKIDAVEKNAKDADEAYNASTKAELTNLVNQTRDRIQEAQAAGQATVEASLAEVQAQLTALEASMKADYESADAAIRTQLVNQLNTLVEQFTGAITSMGNDVAGLQTVQQTLSTKVATLEEGYADLLDRTSTLETTVANVSSLLNSAVSFVLQLDARLEATEEAIASLPAYLAANYASIADVQAYAAQVNTSLETLINYFKVDGAVKTMSDVNTALNTLDERLTEDENAINDFADEVNGRLDQIEEDIETLQEVVLNIENLNKKFEDFYGEETTNLKAQLVESLFSVINEYEDGLDELIEELRGNYEHIGEEVPAGAESIYARLSDSDEFQEMADAMMIVMTRIILAKDAASAQAVYDGYVGDIEFDVDALRFEVEKSRALVRLYECTKSGELGVPMFLDYDGDTLYSASPIKGVTFDNSEEDDKHAYYEAKVEEVKLYAARAEAYQALVWDLDGVYDTIYGYADDADRETPDLDNFLDLVEDLADVDAFNQAMEETDDENQLVITTPAQMAAYNNSILDDAEFIRYAADKLSTLVLGKNAEEAEVANDYEAILNGLDTDYATTIYNTMAAAVAQDAYETAFASAREDNEALADRKAALDAYIDARLADCVYEKRVAKLIADIEVAALEADDEIGALGHLSSGQVEFLTGLYAAADVPTLDHAYELTTDVYTDPDTGDVYEEKFTTQEEFDAVYNAATTNIQAVVMIATYQDAMIALTDDRLTAIANLAAEPGLPDDVVDAAEEFEYFVAGALANYNVASDSALRNPYDPTGEEGPYTVVQLATVSAQALADLTSDTKDAKDAYNEYIAYVKAADDLNEHIEARMAGFEDNFAAARDIYNPVDAATVLSDNAANIASLKNDYKTSHGDVDPTVAEYVYGDAEDYAAEVEALAAFRETVAHAQSDIITTTNNFDTAAAALEVEMAAEFDELEEARLADEQATYTAELDAIMDKINEYLGVYDGDEDGVADITSTQINIANALIGAAKDSIANATLSNQPEAIFAATYKNIAEKVFGLKNTNEYDPSDTRYKAAGEPGYKTAIEQLDALLA